MNKWVQIDFKNFMILIGALFLMIVMWNVMVVNHRKDIDRDKFMATHCLKVDHIYGEDTCDNNPKDL